MGSFDTGRVIYGSPPSTPRSVRTTSGIKQLVTELNRDCPYLHLRTRGPLDSPSSGAKNQQEVCYDRLSEYYHLYPEKLDVCLRKFRQRMISVKPQTVVLLFLDCLPLPSRAFQASPSKSQPKTPILSFAVKMRGQTRAKTPEPDDEAVSLPYPDSPSAGRSLQRGRADGLKRSSDYDESQKSSKLQKSSPRSTYYGDLPSSFPLVDTSWSLTRTSVQTSAATSTNQFDRHMRPSQSFDTEQTLPDRDFNSSGQYGSNFSLNSAVLQMEEPVEQNQRPHSRFSKFLDKLIEAKGQQDLQAVANSKESSPPPVTPSRGIRTSFAGSLNVGLKSPSQKLSAMQLSDTGIRLKDSISSLSDDQRTGKRGKVVRDCPQIGDFADHGMFVPDLKSPGTPFRVLWEIQRWSAFTGLSSHYLLDDLLRSGIDVNDYSQLVLLLQAVMSKHGKKLAPPHCSAQAWQSHECPEVEWKGCLTFDDTKDAKHLFKLSLQPLRLDDKSCRQQRRHGSHRYLYLDVPKLSDGHFLRFLDWLRAPKQFLGRKWQAVHIEQSDAKKTDPYRYLGYRVILLALSGEGLQPLTVDHFLRQFMSLDHSSNKAAPFRKLVTRLDLGFSKTTPTITFLPSQVEWKEVQNIRADDTPESHDFRDLSFDWRYNDRKVEKGSDGDMTDGCGIISVAAMKLVWKALGGKGSLPAAVQGRLGGVKGMFVRSGEKNSNLERDRKIWIEIRPSQMKFPPPESAIDNNFDPHDWTLEVNSFVGSQAHEKMVGSLHMSMIPLLVDRRVPITNIEAVMSEALAEQNKDILEILEDPIELLYWLNNRQMSSEGSKRDADDRSSSLPGNYRDRARFLLEHGIEPSFNPYLTELIRSIAADDFSKTAQKLSVRLESSITTKGVADPIGVLKPNTIHVAFSQSFEDKVSGEDVTDLDGLQGVITRFPMHLPSDMQKIKIVYEPRLKHLKNCIVFPTCGPRSLPSKLQGGDLDGDDYTLIWDPRLVADFENAPPPQAIYSAADLGVKTDIRRLEEVLIGDEPFLNFLQEGFKARLHWLPLGRTSRIIENLTYRHATNGMDAYRHESTLKFSALYGCFIDGDKQGHYMSDDRLTRFINEEESLTTKNKNLTRPAYTDAMDLGITEEMTDSIPPTRHPCDVIFFKHVRPAMVHALRQISAFLKKSRSVTDGDLLRKSLEGQCHQDVNVRSEIMALPERLKKLRYEWNHAEWKKKDKKNIEQSNGTAVMQKFLATYEALQPLNPELFYLTIPRLEQEPSVWRLYMASAMYEIFHKDERQTFLYSLAGLDLAYLKAHSKPRRLLLTGVHALMKLKKRKDDTGPKTEMALWKGSGDAGDPIILDIDDAQRISLKRTVRKKDVDMKDTYG